MAASGQALSVLPVNVFLQPGEKTATFTVTNHGASETSVQIRSFAWSQRGDEEVTDPTALVALSPPLATIPAGGSQVVRLVLRQVPTKSEVTYRVLIDQIPPPSEPGVVHVVLRFSIPIFAEPAGRAASDVQFHLEHDAAGALYLVGNNGGNRHDAFRDIALTGTDGAVFHAQKSVSPYVLPGNTRRWLLTPDKDTGTLPTGWKLTARADNGPIERQVVVHEAH